MAPPRESGVRIAVPTPLDNMNQRRKTSKPKMSPDFVSEIWSHGLSVGTLAPKGPAVGRFPRTLVLVRSPKIQAQSSGFAEKVCIGTPSEVLLLKTFWLSTTSNSN